MLPCIVQVMLRGIYNGAILRQWILDPFHMFHSVWQYFAFTFSVGMITALIRIYASILIEWTRTRLFPRCVLPTVWAQGLLCLQLNSKLVSKYLGCFQKFPVPMLVGVSNIYLWLTDQGIKLWLTAAWEDFDIKLVTTDGDSRHRNALSYFLTEAGKQRGVEYTTPYWKHTNSV